MKDLLRSLAGPFDRYRMLVRAEGFASASARAWLALRRGRAGAAFGPWLRANDLDPARPGALAQDNRDASPNAATALAPIGALNEVHGQGPSIGFVIRVSSDDRAALERTVQSVIRQTLPTWEVLFAVADDVDVDIDDWLDVDWRLRRLPEPAGGRNDLIVAAQYATAQFLGAIQQGDTLADEAVDLIAVAVMADTGADLVYTDEARLKADGRIGDFFHKPDWSPEHLQSTNYIGRFAAVRKARLLEADLAHALMGEVSDYALWLALARAEAEILHVDEALYFSADDPDRPIGGFFSQGALEAAARALERHVRLEHPAATVRRGELPGSLHADWPLDRETAVTLVILTGMRRRDVQGRGDVVLATHFVRSIIERSSFVGYRILLVHDGQAPDDLSALLTDQGHMHQAYIGKGPFSFARKANFAVRLVDSGVVVLLNDDMEVIEPGWIGAMAGQAQRPKVGAVGARLLYPDNSIQHAGVVLGHGGATGHILHKARAGGGEYGGFASIERNYSAVTGAAMAFRRTVFDEVGGFDEQFAVDYNDIDFCLRLRRAGYRIVFTPAASLYHFHNSSLLRSGQDPREQQAFIARWRDDLARDPYFSRRFQRRHSDAPLIADAEIDP